MAVTAQFTEQVVAMVTADTRKYLDDQAEALGVSMAEVVRDMLNESRAMREKGKDDA
jgi:hypothetical protein